MAIVISYASAESPRPGFTQCFSTMYIIITIVTATATTYKYLSINPMINDH